MMTVSILQWESFSDPPLTYLLRLPLDLFNRSTVSQVHDWVVYKLGVLIGSVGHKVKIHKITPATGKERGDIEIKDYVVL